MATLLEQAIAKVSALPPTEQEAIAAQILDSFDDEEARNRRFTEKRDILRRMAREALDEDSKGTTSPLGDLID